MMYRESDKAKAEREGREMAEASLEKARSMMADSPMLTETNCRDVAHKVYTTFWPNKPDNYQYVEGGTKAQAKVIAGKLGGIIDGCRGMEIALILNELIDFIHKLKQEVEHG